MSTETSPWKGIFTRRASAEKPKPPKRGDPNASLRELALQQVLSRARATAPNPNPNSAPDQVVESCEDAAAGASLDDLREIASVIALWPPVCLPWVLPRLGHRLLFACFFESDLRSLVSAELLEAAIRRDEQRFRDASDARLSGSTTKYKGDPERAFAAYPLLDVFGAWGEMNHLRTTTTTAKATATPALTLTLTLTRRVGRPARQRGAAAGAAR